MEILSRILLSFCLFFVLVSCGPVSIKDSTFTTTTAIGRDVNAQNDSKESTSDKPAKTAEANELKNNYILTVKNYRTQLEPARNCSNKAITTFISKSYMFLINSKDPDISKRPAKDEQSEIYYTYISSLLDCSSKYIVTFKKIKKSIDKITYIPRELNEPNNLFGTSINKYINAEEKTYDAVTKLLIYYTATDNSNKPDADLAFNLIKEATTLLSEANDALISADEKYSDAYPQWEDGLK